MPPIGRVASAVMSFAQEKWKPGQSAEFLKEVTFRIPMGRPAQPNEYQGVLVFMLSEASAYFNGAVVPMEGGRVVW